MRQALLYSRVFSQPTSAPRSSNWHEQLDHPEWSENVLRQVPAHTRRLPKKQREIKQFEGMETVAEE